MACPRFRQNQVSTPTADPLQKNREISREMVTGKGSRFWLPDLFGTVRRDRASESYTNHGRTLPESFGSFDRDSRHHLQFATLAVLPRAKVTEDKPPGINGQEKRS